MVVGPRYIPVPDASRITPPVQHPGRGSVNPVSLRIELDPGVPLAGLKSPYHKIHITPLSAGRYEITLEQMSVPADRDFELVWQPAAGTAPEAAFLISPQGDEVFALLMVLPPDPTAFERLRAPREVIFVLDNSGSMAGASIEQAKAALSLALARLGPADTFNVVRFNHRTDSLFLGAQPANPQNVQAAERYVGGIRAEGGTEMLPALLRALDGQEQQGRLRQVIFLTDGAVGNEEQLFRAIRERLGSSRLFTIGIGSAPNSHFMREAARLGRGTFTVARGAARPLRLDAVGARGVAPPGSRRRGARGALGAGEDRRAPRPAPRRRAGRRRAPRRDRRRPQAPPGQPVHQPRGRGRHAAARRRASRRSAARRRVRSAEAGPAWDIERSASPP